MISRKLWNIIFALHIIIRLSFTLKNLPHIVFVLVDDLGYFSPGYNNDELVTPTLDELARNGIILQENYAYKLCAPSRASFLSGRYPFKHSAIFNDLALKDQVGVDLGYTFLSQRLLDSGYHTYHTGKWHVGFHAIEYTPTFRGFMESNGILGPGADYFTQGALNIKCFDKVINVRDIFVNGKPHEQPPGEYNEHRYTNTAVETIQRHHELHGTDGTPLFLFLALQSPHVLIETEDKYSNLYPNITYKLQKTYYGMISAIDDSVKNVTDALKSTNMWNNTLFVFSSDNGAKMGTYDPLNWPATGSGSNYPLRGSKDSNWEGGMKVPAFVSGGFLPISQRGKSLKGIVHIVDWYATFLSIIGVDPSDPHGPSPIDSINLWPWLSGQIGSSPRTFMVYDHVIQNASAHTAIGAIRKGPYKLMVGSQHMAGWYGGPENNYFTPNQSMPKVDGKIRACYTPCLFDVLNDPTEHIDLSNDPASASMFATLMEDWDALFDEYHPSKDIPPADHDELCHGLNASHWFLSPYYTLPTVSSSSPSIPPTLAPSSLPSIPPTLAPSSLPSISPTLAPSSSLSSIPPTLAPSSSLSSKPPTLLPTSIPTYIPAATTTKSPMQPITVLIVPAHTPLNPQSISEATAIPSVSSISPSYSPSQNLNGDGGGGGSEINPVQDQDLVDIGDTETTHPDTDTDAYMRDNDTSNRVEQLSLLLAAITLLLTAILVILLRRAKRRRSEAGEEDIFSDDRDDSRSLLNADFHPSSTSLEEDSPWSLEIEDR